MPPEWVPDWIAGPYIIFLVKALSRFRQAAAHQFSTCKKYNGETDVLTILNADFSYDRLCGDSSVA